MRRRSLLASAGLFFTGCLGNAPDSDHTHGTCTGPLVESASREPRPENGEFEIRSLDVTTDAETDALNFDTAVKDWFVTPGDPGTLELGLRNRNSTSVTIPSGSVPPFEMIYADKTDGQGEFILWRPYTSDGCYHRMNEGWISCDIGVLTDIEPCQRLTRTYDILPSTTETYPEDTVPPALGDYQFGGTLRYKTDDGEDNQLSYRVAFTLDSL